MSDYTFTFAALASANDYADINTLAEALGHGPGTLSVPLSADGTAPATHFGTATYVTQTFLDTISTALQGNTDLDNYTSVEVQAILSTLTYSITTDSSKDAFDNLISDNNLRRVINNTLNPK